LVAVSNPITSFRQDETVSVDWKLIAKKVPGLNLENAAVLDFKTNRLAVCQTLELDGQKTLLFQTDLAPGETKYYQVMEKPAALEQPKAERTTYCRFISWRRMTSVGKMTGRRTAFTGRRWSMRRLRRGLTRVQERVRTR
jgi:hypothetical protein